MVQYIASVRGTQGVVAKSDASYDLRDDPLEAELGVRWT
jgi:hypothetical protein